MLLLMAYQLCFLPRLAGEVGLKADVVSIVGEEMGKADAIIVSSSRTDKTGTATTTSIGCSV
jgi:hypothetical protein